MEIVNHTNVLGWQSNFVADPTQVMVQNVVSNNKLQDVFGNRQKLQNTNHIYSHQVKPRGKITNQKSSGRCWLFAALNVVRVAMMEKYNLKNFEFSQSYLFFWDKLERINYVLESILDAQSNDYQVDSQMIQHLLSDPLSDGGQWDMVANLINKYGLVPKSVYPESRHSSFSAGMNKILSYKVREFSKNLLSMNGNLEAKRELKQQYLKEVHQMLLKFLGTPPTNFDWEYMEGDKYKRVNNLTPQSFYKEHVPFNVNDYYCVINDPRQNHPYNKLYTVKYLGNVVEGFKVRYLNLPIERIRELTANTLKDNKPVWFGCDVGKQIHREQCTMDLDLLSFKQPLGTDFGLSKAERLEYRVSLMTHAMVFSGVDIEETCNAVTNDTKSSVNRWEVENSWSSRGPAGGYYMMTDKWFAEYVYEVLIHKKYLSESETEIINQGEYMTLNPWDPMGSLACE